jgi:hypothetical protein
MVLIFPAPEFEALYRVDFSGLLIDEVSRDVVPPVRQYLRFTIREPPTSQSDLLLANWRPEYESGIPFTYSYWPTGGLKASG